MKEGVKNNTRVLHSNTLKKENIIATKGEQQHIKVKLGYAYELIIKDDEALSTDFALIARKIDNDLELLLENDTIVIFDNYFEVCSTDLSCLVSLPSEDSVYHAVTGNFTTLATLADGSQIVHLYGDRCILEGIAENQSDLFSQSFKEVYLSDDFYICSILPILPGGGDGDTNKTPTGGLLIHLLSH
jgi:hypothetical protein